MSPDFAMGKLASVIDSCYLELQEIRKIPLSDFPADSLATSSDQLNNRLVCNLVTKGRYFHKSTYETLEWSVQG